MIEQQRSGVSVGKGGKELKLPNYPKAPQYKAWVNKVRSAVSNFCPRKAQEVLVWINKVFEKGTTLEMFADSGR